MMTYIYQVRTLICWYKRRFLYQYDKGKQKFFSSFLYNNIDAYIQYKARQIWIEVNLLIFNENKLLPIPTYKTTTNFISYHITTLTLSLYIQSTILFHSENSLNKIYTDRNRLAYLCASESEGQAQLLYYTRSS